MKVSIALSSSAAFGLLALMVAPSANAALINYTLSPYTGAGVFGTTASLWQSNIRQDSPSNLALLDDTGAATGVTLSYTRDNSGGNTVTGAFAALGASSTHPITPITLSGLTAGAAYSMVIFSPTASTFTLNGVVASTTGTTDWSTLREGENYALFQTTADGSGQISLTGTSAETARIFSAFQLQSGGPGAPSAAAPEPGSLALLLPVMGTVGMVIRTKKRRDHASVSENRK